MAAERWTGAIMVLLSKDTLGEPGGDQHYIFVKAAAAALEKCVLLISDEHEIQSLRPSNEWR
jgi:hypothetical protein